MLPQIPRVHTEPAPPMIPIIDRAKILKTYTPTTPKASPPISPKDDFSLGCFGVLPEDVICTIFSYLSARDLGRMSRTHKTLKRVCNDSSLALSKQKRVARALIVMREHIPICIGFTSQSLKGVLEDRIRLNPEIRDLQGSEYLRALQNCKFVQTGLVDEEGWVISLERPERTRTLRTYILAKDPLPPKEVRFFSTTPRSEFKIMSHWESSRFKTKEIETIEDSPNSPKSRDQTLNSPRSRTTWKLLKLELVDTSSLYPAQKKTIEEAIRILNRRPIPTLIQSRGDLIFSETQENF